MQLFKDMGNDYYRPGVISALVTLHHSNGATTEAARVLKEAVDYYMKRGVCIISDNLFMLFILLGFGNNFSWLYKEKGWFAVHSKLIFLYSIF